MSAMKSPNDTVVCVPATTSSPCAFKRKSPVGPLSPVAGSRVKTTPLPEASSRLPKTIAWTVQAVPRLSGIPSCLRYSTARSPNQESNTAATDARSCSKGSDGNRLSDCSSTRRLRSVSRSAMASAGRSTSRATPARSTADATTAPRSWSRPSTTLAKDCTRRRCESTANRSSVAAASPAAVSSLSPRFRTVSIIPGMDTAAPDLTLTRRGSPGSPSRRPARSSRAVMAVLSSASSPSGQPPSR